MCTLTQNAFRKLQNSLGVDCRPLVWHVLTFLNYLRGQAHETGQVLFDLACTACSSSAKCHSSASTAVGARHQFSRCSCDTKARQLLSKQRCKWRKSSWCVSQCLPSIYMVCSMALFTNTMALFTNTAVMAVFKSYTWKKKLLDRVDDPDDDLYSNREGVDGVCFNWLLARCTWKCQSCSRVQERCQIDQFVAAMHVSLATT